VQLNGSRLAESPSFEGDLIGMNAFKEWGALFVDHANLVLGVSEADKEIKVY
jgi:hypothetical protein